MDMSFRPKAPVITDEIKNDPFYIDISVTEFIKERRIPDEFDRGNTRNTLLVSIAQINNDLKQWKDEKKQGGLDSIKDSTDPMLDGQPQLVILYRSAVFSRAKAQVLQNFETLSQRDEANNLSKSSKETYNSLLAESQRALRTLLDMGGTTVELI